MAIAVRHTQGLELPTLKWVLRQSFEVKEEANQCGVFRINMNKKGK